MLELHQGPRTEAGARENIRVAVQYIAAWLGGRGAVPLYNLMEDAATAEICRAQLWQWLRFEAPFDDGRRFSRDLFEDWLAEELAALDELAPPQARRPPAARAGHRRRVRGIPDAAGVRTAGLRPRRRIFGVYAGSTPMLRRIRWQPHSFPQDCDPFADRRVYPRVPVALPAFLQADGERHAVQIAT